MPCPDATNRAGFRSRFEPLRARTRRFPGRSRIRSYPSVQEIKPEDSGTCSLGQDDDRRRKPPVFPDQRWPDRIPSSFISFRQNDRSCEDLSIVIAPI